MICFLLELVAAEGTVEDILEDIAGKDRAACIAAAVFDIEDIADTVVVVVGDTAAAVSAAPAASSDTL